MADDNEKKEQGTSPQDESSIEKLLRDREKLDAQLKEKFSQNITVMFTDIKGSTNFFETYGDIEGRLMVQKHNEMLFPLVEKHQGKVIKTIGDAIMASFENSVEAVRSAIEMQEALFDYNTQKKEKKDQIHIRIGVNTGEGLVEQKDIFGDVVNVAARVESLTEPDEIMISGPVYEEVRKTDDILCRYADETKVKGKEDPIQVYRVVWGDEDTIGGLTRGAPAAKIARKKKSRKRRLEVDISREGETLKVTASEKSEKGESTVRQYEEMKVSMPKIEERCREITDLLNRANTRGKVSKDILAKLRDVGQVLFDDLLTAQAKEALRKAVVEDLVFHIEDTLVQIPWELLYDGDQFLCQKFNMGRLVKTKRSIVNIRQRELFRPLKMLIVSDPRGDLENSFREGQIIRKELDSSPTFISANQRSGQIAADYIMEKIRNFDMVHYAGHADYDPEEPSNSGWLLDGGKFTSADIMKLVGGRPMPALVFCNACQSGQTEEWKIDASYNQEIFGLANAFLLSGVQHYIGTFWEILDEPGAHFAVEFYRAMMGGASIGEAMRQARMFLIKEYGEDTIVWASYMLYGDPGFNYFEFAEDAEDAEDASVEDRKAAGGELRSPTSETISFQAGTAQPSKNKQFIIGAVLAALVVAVVALFLMRPSQQAVEDDPYLLAYKALDSDKIEIARKGFEGLGADDPKRYEGLAAVYYATGDYDNAQAMTKKALERAPYNLYAHVINGNILFSQGKTDDALKELGKAAERKGGIKWQKAEALNVMARIYSEKGESDKALDFYARAAQLSPQNAAIQANYGFALQKAGNSAGAFSSFQKAAQAGPQDPYASFMLAKARQEQKATEDNERQQRIDKLVSELAASFKKGDAPPPVSDQWTSKAVTISFLDFNKKGTPSMREGEDEFFLFQVNALLQETGGIQIVEREILDKLLAELKLSSTDLVDKRTSLQLGRILSARIIATGSIMRYGKDIQVSIRLTDTETTALKGAITASDKTMDKLAEVVVNKIAEKIKKAYPLRAAVMSVEEDQVVLDAGTDAGVNDGMEFSLLEEIKGPDGSLLRYKPVGTLTVASVQENVSYAVAGDQSLTVRKGMKVEQLVRR